MTWTKEYKKEYMKNYTTNRIKNDKNVWDKVRREYQTKRYLDFRKWIDQIKKNSKCKICGISGKEHPEILDFHHGEERKFSITQGHVYNFSKKRVQKEIDKCIIICANCHRILHNSKRRENKLMTNHQHSSNQRTLFNASEKGDVKI